MFMMWPIVIIAQSFYKSEGVTHYSNLLTRIVKNWSFENINIDEMLKVSGVMLLFNLYEYFLYWKKDEFALLKLNYYIQVIVVVTAYFIYRNIGVVADINFLYYDF